MRFYTNHHQFYCGIDLHARQMYVCILDQEGDVQFHRNMPTYWLADFCDERHIPFALGHALYMKAIHGGKIKKEILGAVKAERR